MDLFELQEMEKTRSVVKSKLKNFYDWLVDYVPKSIKEPVGNAFSKVKSRIMGLYEGARKTLKGEVEEQAEKEDGEGEENVEIFAPIELAKAMSDAYKSFRIYGRDKTDIDYSPLSWRRERQRVS